MLDRSATLVENFKQTADEHADRLALTFVDVELKPSSYTYRQLFDRSHEIAQRLESCQLNREAPFGILLQSQEMQVLHYLAALSVGLVPAILTPPNRKLDRDYYLQTTCEVVRYCGFSAVVTQLADFTPNVPVLEPNSLKLIHDATEVADRQTGNCGDAVFLQFSSGTTGIKKGVLVDDRAVLSQLDAYSNAIGLNKDDVIVSWLPLYHDMGFMTALNMALACGVHSVMLDPLDWVANPGMYLKAVTHYCGTLGWHPNFAFAFMADRIPDRDLPDLDLSSLRGLVNCSEPVTKTSQDRFADRFASNGLSSDVFWGCYAMAETTFAITHGTIRDDGSLDPVGPQGSNSPSVTLPAVSVGRTIEGVELDVRSDNSQPLDDREVGDLWAKSPFNFNEYYNNPESTNLAFHGDWYKTGDLGYRIGDSFFVCGRKKDMLIVGGVNIYPEDLEQTISQVDGVQPGRVAAFAEFDPRLQTERVVILAESSVTEDEQMSLMLEIRKRILAEFQIANFEVHFVASGWLVKSSAGKMARGINREKWQQLSGTG